MPHPHPSFSLAHFHFPAKIAIGLWGSLEGMKTFPRAPEALNIVAALCLFIHLLHTAPTHIVLYRETA